MSFQGVNGGVGYSDPASDADSRRRQMMAQMMMQQVNQPAGAGWEGTLNKVLAGALAGYSLNKDAEEQTARGDARNATMADALRAGQGQAAETKQYGDGTTIDWDERKADPKLMASILAGNRDTAPLGMQMQMSQMDNAAKSQAELAQLLFKNNLERENERLKPREIGDDKRWFVPDLPGQTQAQTPAPQMAPPAQAPGGGVDIRTAANGPPVPLTATSGSGPMGPNSNNPGNIRTSDGNAWQGKTTQPGSQFEQFDTPENGIRAMGVLVNNYAKQGVNTLGGIVSKWAPPNENQTGALITNAAKRTGLDPNQPLDMSDPAVRGKVVQALLMQEQGKVPYGQDVVQAGVDASFGRPAQAPAAQPPRVQVADASGSIPASVPAPGAQRVTMGGQSGTVIGGQGGPKYRQMTPDEVKAAGLPPGFIAQIDRNGQIHKVDEGNNGSGAMFPGKTNEAAAYNTYRTLQGKLSRGEQLTGDEQFDLQIAQQVLTQPKTVMTDNGLASVTPPPLPTRNAPQASPAQVASTDTVPNPVQPGAVPAAAPPASPAQPQVKIIQEKAVPKPTNEQNLNAGFANRLNAAHDIFDGLEREGYVNPSLKDRAASNIPVVGGYLESNNFQKQDQARREFINAQLRRESGASISPAEFENANRQYFPQPGDGPDVLAQKRLSREMAITNMAQAAGPAELGFKLKPQPKAGDKPATTSRILKFDGEGNIIQ